MRATSSLLPNELLRRLKVTLRGIVRASENVPMQEERHSQMRSSHATQCQANRQQNHLTGRKFFHVAALDSNACQQVGHVADQNNGANADRGDYGQSDDVAVHKSLVYLGPTGFTQKPPFSNRG